MTLLLEMLRAPAKVPDCTPAQHDLLLRQAASAQLSATLCARLRAAGVWERMPAAPARQLDWAWRHSQWHLQSVHWEVRQITAALRGQQAELILLKGAAYAMAGLQAGAGRVFSDIDILVPRNCLAEVEAALMLHGWAGIGHDAYDDYYYRRWMHELPPMRHIWRGSMIDVHHAILPRTAAARPDSERLRAAARPLAGHAAQPGVPVLYLLAPADLVLHCASHLLYDSEFGAGLRNLVDLDSLLREYGGQACFWPSLPARARELGLVVPLYYALDAAAYMLHTPLPAGMMAQLAEHGPSARRAALMRGLLARALLPEHASCNGVANRLARQLLYLRATWLRMPPWLLARHLARKVFVTPLQAWRSQ
jgi:hypothetical protein